MTEPRLQKLKESLSKLGLKETSGGAEGYRVEVVDGQVKVTVLLNTTSQDGKAESFRKAIHTAGLQQRLQDFEAERARDLELDDPVMILFRESSRMLYSAAVDRRNGPSYKAFLNVRTSRTDSASSVAIAENFKEISESRAAVRDIAQARRDRARSEDTRETIANYLVKEEKLFEMLRIIVKHSTPITYLMHEHYSYTQLKFIARSESARDTKYRELHTLNLARDRVFTRPSAASNQHYLDTAKAFYANADLRALFISEVKNARREDPEGARRIDGSWTSYKAAGDDLLGDIEMAMLIDEI